MNKDNNTPLYETVGNGNSAVISVLIQHGAEVNEREKRLFVNVLKSIENFLKF